MEHVNFLYKKNKNKKLLKYSHSFLKLFSKVRINQGLVLQMCRKVKLKMAEQKWKCNPSIYFYFFNPPRTPYTWVCWDLEELVGVERVVCSKKYQAVFPQLLWLVWWHDLHWAFLLDLQRKRAMDPQTLWWVSWSRIIVQLGVHSKKIFIFHPFSLSLYCKIARSLTGGKKVNWRQKEWCY